MTKLLLRESSLGAIQITRVTADYVGQVGSAFFRALERLYAAHMERKQMRLAPTRVCRFQTVRAGRCY